MATFEIYKILASVFGPLVPLIYKRLFPTKAKLQVSMPHRFTFTVEQPLIGADGSQLAPTQFVGTNSLLMRNGGSEAATKIEVVFNWAPMCVNVWPARSYGKTLRDDQRYVITIDDLLPGESLGIELLSINQQVPGLVSVRCAQGLAKDVPMFPQPAHSKKLITSAAILMLFGAGTVVYLLITLGAFVVRRISEMQMT